MAEIDIIRKLDENGVWLNESLGQHFLVDEEVVNTLTKQVREGAVVIEVGSGVGHVTERLSERASRVIGIEIDRRFQPKLEDLQDGNPKLSFIMGDALKVPMRKIVEEASKGGQEVQIVANLPFHITEPFMRQLVDLPVTSATLMLGEKAGKEVQASYQQPEYGRMSLVAQSFFNVRQIVEVPKSSFVPVPRTDSLVVELEAKDKKELKAQPDNFLFTELIRREQKYGPVINDLKQALVDTTMGGNGNTLSKAESHRRDRSSTRQQLRQMVSDYNNLGEVVVRRGRNGDTKVMSQADALDVISKMGIPAAVLNKPFFRLNNNELRELVKGVKGYYYRD